MKKLIGVWLLGLLIFGSAQACFNPADQWAAGVVFNNGETVDLSLINGCGEEGTNYIAGRDSGLTAYIKYRSIYDPAHALVYLGYFNVTFNTVYNIPRLAVILDTTQNQARFDFAAAVRQELDRLTDIGILDMGIVARQEAEDSLAAAGQGNAQYWSLQKQVLAYNSFYAYDENTGTWDMLAANTFRACGLDVAYEMPPAELLPAGIGLHLLTGEQTLAQGIKVSPHPFTRTAIIRLPEHLSGAGAMVDIYDTRGRHLASLGFSGLPEITWDASGLPGGLYLVRVSANGRTFVRKVLRQKQAAGSW